MKIKYWKNFSKRRNSTKQPTSGTEIDVDLLEPCSTETPRFILSIIDPTINYIEAFNHFYYVNDRVILDDERMLITCSMDELATAKSDILDGYAFIERSTVINSKMIVDPLVSTDGVTICDVIAAQEGTPYGATNEGYYILGVICNENHVSPGMCHYYLVEGNGLKSLRQFFTSPPATIESWMITTFGNTFAAIVSCKYIPLKASTLTFGGTVLTPTTITLGNHNTGIDAQNISGDDVVLAENTILVPEAYRKDFRKLEPYSSFKLFIPNYGMVNIPGSCISDTIKIKYSFDILTGETYVRVCTVNDADNIIASIQYNMGIDIPIAQLRTMTSNAINGIVSGATAIAGAATGNPLLIGGAVASGTMGIISGVADQAISVKGGMGGRSMVDYNAPLLYVNKVSTTDEETTALETYYGKPYMEVNKISMASGGYVKTRNASIPTHLTPDETMRINAALDSGIYIE